MSDLEILFAVVSLIVSIIGIVVGIIGAKSISFANKYKNIFKGENNTITLDQSITNGVPVDQLPTLQGQMLSFVSNLFDRQTQLSKDNFVAILKETIPYLNQTQNPKSSIDETWALNFFKYSSNASSLDLQKMWAKLLSSKMNGTNDVSMRTMSVLSNLSPNEAQLFEKVSKMSIGPFHILPKDYIDKNSLISFDEIQKLKECGLLSTETFLSFNTTFNNNQNQFLNNNYVLFYSPTTNQKEHTISIYGFTNAGNELIESLSIPTDDTYFISFAKWFKTNNNNLNVTLHKINIICGNQINYNKEDIIDK